MNLTEITTSSGKLIYVYDGLVPYSLMMELYFDLRTKEYPLVSQNDTALLDYTGVFGFGKSLPQDFILQFISRTDRAEAFPLTSILRKYTPRRSWVNVYNGYHPTNRYHSDEGCKLPGENYSLLYYANPKWDLEWDGGTVFRSEDLEKVEYLSDYKPGRFVLFDSSIPHKIYQTSLNADPYRFTINTVFSKNENFQL